MESNSKHKLIYYYDALCGWCYGFSSVMSEIEKKYQDQINIEVISGGLFSGNRVGRVNDVAPHIKAGAYKSVEARTGVKFGEIFLKEVFGEGKMVFNSLPPAIALCIVKEQYPEHELNFAKMLLKAVYFNGLNPTDINGLAEYASKVGFDKDDFITKMGESQYKIAAEKEFEIFSNSRSGGMPTLALEKEGQQILLSTGYTHFEVLKDRLDQLVL